MAIFTRRREPERQEVDISTLLAEYDIIDVNKPGGFLVVSEKPKQLAAGATVSDLHSTELGYAGDSQYSRIGQNDYNPEVRGWYGLRKWDEMRRSDGSVRGVLRLVKTPIYGARWFVEPVSNSKQDMKVAQHIEDCLFRKMSVSWPQLLTEINLHLDFGYYAFEKVFAYEGGKTIWKKWAPRHPLSIYNWEYDSHGGPNGCWAYAESGDGKVFMPIDTLLVFTNEKEAGNMEGLSILRSAYKHWFYVDNLYKIDAIQKERHGIGVPMIKLPPGFSTEDKAAADKIGANLRTNEKAHIVLPPMWDVVTLKLEGQHVDALISAQWHRDMIYSSVLADFMATNTRPDQFKVDLFQKSTRFVADQICDIINKWAIPELVDYNWKTVTEYPQLRVRRIGETVDWQKISMALRNLVGAGIIKPDDQLEDYIRDEMDLPAADPNTARAIATPQNPAAPKPSPAGPPKQSTTANNTQGTTPGAKGGGGPGGSPRAG